MKRASRLSQKRSRNADSLVAPCFRGLTICMVPRGRDMNPHSKRFAILQSRVREREGTLADNPDGSSVVVLDTAVVLDSADGIVPALRRAQARGSLVTARWLEDSIRHNTAMPLTSFRHTSSVVPVDAAASSGETSSEYSLHRHNSAPVPTLPTPSTPKQRASTMGDPTELRVRPLEVNHPEPTGDPVVSRQPDPSLSSPESSRVIEDIPISPRVASRRPAHVVMPEMTSPSLRRQLKKAFVVKDGESKGVAVGAGAGADASAASGAATTSAQRFQMRYDTWADKNKHKWACQNMDLGNGRSNLNEHISAPFEELEEIYSVLGDKFRTMTYRRQVGLLKQLDFRLTMENVDAWCASTKFMGRKGATKVKEILQTGKLRRVEELRKSEQVRSLLEFGNIFGVGPNTAQKFYNLGARTLSDLRRNPAIQLSSSQDLGLKYFNDLKLRIPRKEVEAIEHIVRTVAQDIMPGVTAVCCGSYRRGKPTSGDADVLLTHPDWGDNMDLPAVWMVPLMEAIKRTGLWVGDLGRPTSEAEHGSATSMGLGRIPEQVEARMIPGWETKGHASGGAYPDDSTELVRHPRFSGVVRRIDIKLYPPKHFPFALLYFTGSDHFNRSMRHFAKKKGWSLSDHGIKPVTGRVAGKRVATGIGIECATEEDIFKALGLDYVAPRDRNVYETWVGKKSATDGASQDMEDEEDEENADGHKSGDERDNGNGSEDEEMPPSRAPAVHSSAPSPPTNRSALTAPGLSMYEDAFESDVLATLLDGVLSLQLAPGTNRVFRGALATQHSRQGHSASSSSANAPIPQQLRSCVACAARLAGKDSSYFNHLTVTRSDNGRGIFDFRDSKRVGDTLACVTLCEKGKKAAAFLETAFGHNNTTFRPSHNSVCVMVGATSTSHQMLAPSLEHGQLFFLVLRHVISDAGHVGGIKHASRRSFVHGFTPLQFPDMPAAEVQSADDRYSDIAGSDSVEQRRCVQPVYARAVSDTSSACGADWPVWSRFV